ncbi:MAG: Hsp20/alpha crystallin family protein [Patescibacteria group bacterium]
MAIVRWAPMFPATDEFDKWFEDWPGLSQMSNFVPALDVYQTKDTVVVETPLVGINPDNVNISIENDVLTLEGKSEKKSEVDEKNYYRKEVRYGSFHRSIVLPAAVSGDKAKATYEKGVLKIIIPKEERAKPKTVKVEVKD